MTRLDHNHPNAAFIVSIGLKFKIALWRPLLWMKKKDSRVPEDS